MNGMRGLPARCSLATFENGCGGSNPHCWSRGSNRRRHDRLN
jgi:hypothetical protein